MDRLIHAMATPPHFWLAVAFVLMISELLTGTTYLLWPAAAAVATALFAAALPGANVMLQIALFAALTILLVMFARPIVQARLQKKSENSTLNNRAAALIGSRASATQAFVNGVGAVKINDSTWRAKSDDPIEAGVEVEVLAVDGVTLTVRRGA